MTASELPVMKISELDSGYRVERGIVYDRGCGVPLGRLAPKSSSPRDAAGAQAGTLDRLDAIGLCACWTAPPGRRCKAVRP